MITGLLARLRSTWRSPERAAQDARREERLAQARGRGRSSMRDVHGAAAGGGLGAGAGFFGGGDSGGGGDGGGGGSC